MAAFLWLIGVLLIPVLVIAKVRGIRNRASEMVLLVREGKSTTATIMDHHRVYRNKGHSLPKIKYSFTPPSGKPTQHEVVTSETLYERTDVGMEIKIVYWPKNPAVNALEDMVDNIRKAMPSSA